MGHYFLERPYIDFEDNIILFLCHLNRIISISVFIECISYCITEKKTKYIE